MYALFEIKKVLSLAKGSSDSCAKIKLSAYCEYNGRGVLALVCDNGYFVFYYWPSDREHPVIRQINWLHTGGKEVRAISFDPYGAWLLIVTADASIYVLPVLLILDENAKVSNNWRPDNITEIKLTGHRAPLTSVRWWQTLQGQHIAVVGSELGEIAFVNLVNKKEVGGTYINVGISALDILKDESRDTSYLLITGHNRQQWRLLLEEKRSNFYWPFNAENEATVACDTTKGLISCEKAPLKEEKVNDQKPHHLSKFESGTFLTPQGGEKHNLVSAYNSSSALLQVLEGDLDQMHLFSYNVPTDCENVILSDKLIFLTQSTTSTKEKLQTCLKIFSRKFSEICSENAKKREHQNAEMQSFILDGKVLALYRRNSNLSDVKNLIEDPSVCSKNHRQISRKRCYSREIPPSFQNFGANSSFLESFSSIIYTRDDETRTEPEQKQFSFDFLQSTSRLDGCYIIQESSVWECRLRFPPEFLFLSLTNIPSDLPMAEKLGVMLGLEIHKMYELAAEMQLANGHFAQAVHLYQLSKCPQLKRIAHFMSYGYLSELIAYIQVLFSTKSVEIVSADKCHFANIALLCFAQQAMEKMNERSAITSAFKKFLRDNIYYDETVAIKLLAEQGLYELLYYFSQVRGQHGLIVETLLAYDSLQESVDTCTYNSLSTSGYEKSILHLNNDDYMLCMTSYQLLQYLAAKPVLLSQHMQHLIALLPEVSVDILFRIASLYDLSRSASTLSLRNIGTAKERIRYWNTGLQTLVPSDRCNMESENNIVSEGDLVKFFIFVLLMLCHHRNQRRFDLDLLPYDVHLPTKSPNAKNSSLLSNSQAVQDVQIKPLSCGLAHVAYCCDGVLFTWGKASNGRLGNGDVNVEFETPAPVSTFLQLGIKVISVSCGSDHTLALTDFGVFSWGLSRYGQLGLGEIQHSDHPVNIECLTKEQVVAVQCGQYHSMALTAAGRVYSWGWGVHGQLGHGTPEDLNYPKVIEHLKSKVVVSLSAGQGHSVVLTNKGEVYAFGCGMFGQLGTGSVSKHSLPQHVSIPESISKIASGFFHTVAVSDANNIYVWGCNPQALRLQAQCSRRARQNNNSQNLPGSSPSNNATGSAAVSGTRSSTNSIQQTHLLPLLIDSTSISNPVLQVSCGNHHSLILTTEGEVYSWGRNMEGQLGNGSRREQKTPYLVTLPTISKVKYASCGADFTIALDSDGKLWGWGKNDSGQLGQKPTETSARSTASPGGKVITIRTNRRMITITQPNRQSLLRPVEIAIPRDELKIQDFANRSFESECAIPLLEPISVSDGTVDIGDLSAYDNPSYGPRALHATLKTFHKYCDYRILLNHCVSFANFQAAAKICLLQDQHSEALDYQFKAIVADPNVLPAHYSTYAISVINNYISLMDSSVIEKNHQFLCCMIKFWMNYNLPLLPFESLLEKNFKIFSYSLGVLLFCESADIEKQLTEKFLSLLSTDMCLHITFAAIDKIQNKSSHLELMEEMMMISKTRAEFHAIYSSDTYSVWNDSVSPDRLWQEILHNIQKGIINKSALDLSSSDVDILSKLFISGKLCIGQSSGKMSGSADGNNDIIAFSCHHHYTLQAFQASVLPSFADSLKKMLIFSPSVSKLFMSCYDVEETILASCPKCLLNEIRSEF